MTQAISTRGSSFGLKVPEIVDGSFKPGDIIFKAAETDVALSAKESANCTGSVVMIDGKAANFVGTAPFAPAAVTANGTDTTLSGIHLVPFWDVNSVLKPEIVGSLNVTSKRGSLGFDGILRDGLAGLKRRVLSVFRRGLLAPGFMSNAGIEAVKRAAVFAGLKDPTSGAADDSPSGIFVVLLSPFFVTLKAACLACRIKAVTLMDGLGKIGQRKQLLASRTDLAVFRPWAFLALVPDMAKEAFGRYRFSAPDAFHYSLYRICVPGHDVSPRNASREFLADTASIRQLASSSKGQ